MSDRPKRKRDWEGRYVRLLRPFETSGGALFNEGDVVRVERNFNGLHLEKIHSCAECGSSARARIRGVDERDVWLLAVDYKPDGRPACGRCSRLQEVMVPVAAYVAATLAPAERSSDGLIPDDFVLAKANDVPLTAGHVRALLKALGR